MSRRAAVRTLLSGALIVALAAGTLLGLSTPATAAENTAPPPVDNPANAVTADALPTAQINGVVWDQEVVGTTVYAGGQFTSARPAGSAIGVNESPRANLMSYDLTTGVMTSWAPSVNGRIRVVTASPDGSRIYIGGSFTEVNGRPRYRVAAFNTSDGSLVESFAPTAGSDVFAIAATDSVVYLGGWFGSMNNVARTRLAAVSAADGGLLGWQPTADHTPYALALTPAQDRVVVSGGFAQLNGSSAPSLGSLDAVTGESYPFAVNQVIRNTGNTAYLMSAKVVDDKVYSTGVWFGGTGNFEGTVVADAYTGEIRNLINCLGDTYDAAPMNGLVYSVSHHHQCTDSGGFPETSPRSWQHTDAFTIEPTGTVQPNTYGYPNFAGHPSGSSVNWFPTMSPGKASGAGQAGWTVETSGEYLLVAGEFLRVNNTAQQGLVRFATRAVVTQPRMGPSSAWADTTPRVDNLLPNASRVRFMADFDRDGSRTMSYKVIRSDLGESRPVYTTTAASNFWQRPWLQFVDDTLVPGRTYWYRVIATDSDGNSRAGNVVSFVAGDNTAEASTYSQQVAADGATHYWRLREATGAAYGVDYGTAGTDLTLGSGVVGAVEGAILGSSDPAASFPGTSAGGAASSVAETAPDTFSAEVWFRTTTGSGGKLLGFGGSASGLSSSYDRHLYMNDAGQLTFGVYPNGARTVSSARSYNDGVWHHAVATLGPAGMTLHVDGLKVGVDSSVTSGQSYTGHWRVGGDSTSGWPQAGSSNHFAGDLDDIAIYPTALTQEQIRDHYAKSGRSVELPPLPEDAYGREVLTDAPSLYWRLNDTGSTAEDASGNVRTGTYHNHEAQQVPSDVVPGNAAVRFDGIDDVVSTDSTVQNPLAFTVEAWFNTTSTAGGKIIGLGNRPQGWSSSYDRHVYLNPAGQVNFGAYTGRQMVVTSEQSYNDGAWHHVVATMGPDGMRLYVDGLLQASNANTAAQNYAGHWRIGGDASWSGNSFFEGLIDEAAVYDSVLDASRVLAHYKASPAARNALPTVAIESSCVGLECGLTAVASDPDGSIASVDWDLGDGAGATGATVTHTYAEARTYTVTVTVTDDAGATATATQDISVRVPRPTPTDVYGAHIHRDNPLVYWRLGETEGPIAEDASLRVHDGTYSGDVTLGEQSPVTDSDTAARLGTEGRVTSNDRFVNPTEFSLEAWFSTTGTGGRIVGFGNQQAGRSSSYDRHLYLDETGRAVFGVWTGSAQTVVSPEPLNDGAWHHVVATLGPNGMELFVDGRSVATNPNTAAQNYDGYWRVGADHVWSGSGNFHGTIDEVAVYGTALTADQVLRHHAASESTNDLPTAEFEATMSGLTLMADGQASADADGTIVSHEWDFGDGTTGSGATVEHTYPAAGTHTVTLTVTDDRGARSTTTRQVEAVVPNTPPAAAFTSAVSDLSAEFDGTGSSDPDGSIVSYGWSFGDGATASGVTVGHTYASAGTYEVSLTVTDDRGATATSTERVEVAEPVVHVVASDVFGRSVASGWGSSDVGGSWTTSGSGFSVNGAAGVVGLSATSTRVATLAGVSASDVSIVTDVALDKAPAGGSLSNQVLARVSGSTYYMLTARMESSGALRVYVSRVVSGVETTVASRLLSGFGYSAGERLHVRFDVVGSSLSGWVWRDGEEQPAAATVSGSDATAALQRPGAVGLKWYAGASLSNGPFTAQVDNYRVTSPQPVTNAEPTAHFTAAVQGLQVNLDAGASTDPDGSIVSYGWSFGDGATASGVTVGHTYASAGTYEVSLTVTDDRGATATSTERVEVAEPVVHVVASDVFGRSVASGWGSSDVGGSWTTSGSGFSVNGAAGVVGLSATSTRVATLAGVSASDVSIVTDVALDKAPAGGSLSNQVLARVSGSTYYMLTARMESSGALRVYVSRVVSGVETTVASRLLSGFGYSAGERLHVRFDVVGSSLSGWVWRDGEEQPAAATVSGSDATAALQRPGAVGLKWYAGASLSNGPFTAQVDNYQVEERQ